MYDLYGQQCVLCGRLIGLDGAARRCTTCRRPVHEECIEKIGVRNGEGGFCTECGATHTGAVITGIPMRTTAPGERTGKFFGALLVLAIFFGLSFLLRGNKEKQLAETLKPEIERQQGLKLQNLTLQKTGDNSFKGIALTDTGEEYDLRVTIDPAADQVHWQLRPPLAKSEEQVRKLLEDEMKVPVKSLALRRNEDGSVIGEAEIVSGEKYQVMERPFNNQVLLWAELAEESYSIWARNEAGRLRNIPAGAVELKKQPDNSYRGQATFADDTVFEIEVRVGEATLPNGMPKRTIELRLLRELPKILPKMTFHPVSPRRWRTAA